MEADLIERLALEASMTAEFAPQPGRRNVRISAAEGEDLTSFLHRFAAGVAEECAKACETEAGGIPLAGLAGDREALRCAAAIRAKFPA